jgi:putative nucleotidyltransferase with HDIG domain
LRQSKFKCPIAKGKITFKALRQVTGSQDKKWWIMAKLCLSHFTFVTIQVWFGRPFNGMNKNVDSYINEVKSLPTAPGVLVRLISLFQRPDREVDDIVELILQDPALTAGVLRHANSAFAVPEEPIVDVFDAITWVGFSQVYQAVVAKLASQTLQLPKGAVGIDVDRLWRHSAIAGVSAGAIARRVQESESLAFTAGLLHDVGKIVLSLAEGANYAALVEKAGDRGAALLEAEERAFGFGHAEIGSRLLTRWGLPDTIFEPVRQHHQANWSQPLERINAVVSLANVMAHAAEANIPGGQYESETALGAMRVLQLNEDDLAALLKRAEKDIARMTGVLGAGAR